MTISASSSLQRLLEIFAMHNPEMAALLAADTEPNFIAETESTIGRAVTKMESSAKHYSPMPEPGLSMVLTDLLSMAGLRATAETNVNGHVDIVIEHAFGRDWKYLGECKIYHGYKYHLDGCEQLLGYCTGRELRAFCLEFFKVAGMYQKMQQLRDDFDKNTPLAQQNVSNGHSIKGAFVTCHHHVAGRDVEVLHLGCSLHVT